MDPITSTEPLIRALIKRSELCIKVLTHSSIEPLPVNLTTITAKGLDDSIKELCDLILKLPEISQDKSMGVKVLQGLILTLLWGLILDNSKSASVLGEAVERLDSSGKLQEEWTLALKVILSAVKC